MFIVTLLAAVGLSAVAQKMNVARDTQFYQKAEVRAAVSKNALKKAPAKAAEETTQMHVGYVSDGASLSAMNVNNGTYHPCSYFSPDLLKKFVGCKVVGMRFAVYSTALQNVTAWISLDPSTKQFLATSTREALVEGWNEVMFATPYTITGNAEEFYVGYTFKSVSSAENTLMTCPGVKTTYGFLLDTSTAFRYSDYTSYGSLAVQLLVEGNLPKYDIALQEFSTDHTYYLGLDATMQMYTYLENKGARNIQGVIFEGMFDDDVTKSFQLQVSDSIPMEGSVLQYALPLSQFGLGVGTHTFSLKAASQFDGTPFTANTTDDDQVMTTFNIYENSLNRSAFVLEMFTHQQSYLDTIQVNIVEKMQKLRTDIVPVFIHGNYFGASYPDQMAMDEAVDYANLFGVTEIPSMMFNRYKMPVYQGIPVEMNATSSNYASYFSNYVTMIDEEVPALATVNITPSAQDGKLVLTVSGMRNGDFKSIFGNGALTVYLLEHGVVAPQLSFTETTISNYEHNNVLRKVVTALRGDEIKWSGLRFNMTYTVDVEPAWSLDDMTAVAFIAKPITDTTRADNMEITNANSVSLEGLNTGIKGIEQLNSSQKDNAVYDLQGRRVAVPSRGIYIKDGVKVLVK